MDWMLVLVYKVVKKYTTTTSFRVFCGLLCECVCIFMVLKWDEMFYCCVLCITSIFIKKVPLHLLHIIKSSYIKFFYYASSYSEARKKLSRSITRLMRFPFPNLWQTSEQTGKHFTCLFFIIILSMCRQTDGLDADDDDVRVCYMYTE